MKLSYFSLLVLAFLFSNCNKKQQTTEISPIQEFKQLFKQHPGFIAKGFDFPVGKPDAKGYYNAQKFRKNNHLGDDWNAVTGGNTDLGDPIFAIGSGYVKFAQDLDGGWGNVIRIVHQLPDSSLYESVYAHCDSIFVKPHTWVKKGEQIGTIGTAHGQYYAHLHFEVRADVTMPLGGGYANDARGYIDPTKFIDKHR